MADPILVVIAILLLILVTAGAVRMIARRQRKTQAVDAVKKVVETHLVKHWDPILPPLPYYYDTIPVTPLYGYYYGGGHHRGRRGSYGGHRRR